MTELAELDEERKKEVEEKACAKELQGEEIRAAAMESLAVKKKTKRDESEGDFQTKLNLAGTKGIFGFHRHQST